MLIKSDPYLEFNYSHVHHSNVQYFKFKQIGGVAVQIANKKCNLKEIKQEESEDKEKNNEKLNYLILV